MEISIAFPVGVDDGPALLVYGRVHGFETEVETKKEVGEVHAQADTVCGGDLLVEFVECKFAVGLVFVFLYSPDVAGVDKDCAFEHPEEFGPVFDAEVEAYVAALVYEVGDEVAAVVCSGAERSDAPSADTVCSAGVEALFERHHR